MTTVSVPQGGGKKCRQPLEKEADRSSPLCKILYDKVETATQLLAFPSLTMAPCHAHSQRLTFNHTCKRLNGKNKIGATLEKLIIQSKFQSILVESGLTLWYLLATILHFLLYIYLFKFIDFSIINFATCPQLACNILSITVHLKWIDVIG